MSIEPIPADEIDATFSSTCIDLISAPLGSKILAFSDEWFAPASNLINPTRPVQRPGVYIETGAWYDGWETRRHNPHPNDWVIIKLGPAAGWVKGVEIDTAFFNGNHAEAIAVQGCFENGPGADESVVQADQKWGDLLPRKELEGNKRHAWDVDEDYSPLTTHVRLLMYPDGGIARFRLWGIARPTDLSIKGNEVELSSALNGGVAIAASDEHYGVRSNLLLPGRGKDMSDGWETKRSRERGHEDWVIVKLGLRGRLSKIVVDTHSFLGNYPKAVRVDAKDGYYEGEQDGLEGNWDHVLPEQDLGPGKEHVFEDIGSDKTMAYTHVRMTIIPDGGHSILQYRAMAYTPSFVAAFDEAYSTSGFYSGCNAV